jgi:polyisoprenoid-binding protein YceI
VFHVILTSVAMGLGIASGSPPTLTLESPRSVWAVDIGVQEHSPDTTTVRWVVGAPDSEARYRVQEQLAGFDFPNDAVGTTTEITGVIVVGPDGTIVSDRSEFRIQLASLATDNQRRDNYVRGRTLEVEQYPEAVLVPRRFLGLRDPLAESGSQDFQLEGDLTLHGHTRTTTWEVTAAFGSEAITGLATTAFPFDTFQIPVPRVARVLSVDDNIRLEMAFRLLREGS